MSFKQVMFLTAQDQGLAARLNFPFNNRDEARINDESKLLVIVVATVVCEGLNGSLFFADQDPNLSLDPAQLDMQMQISALCSHCGADSPKYRDVIRYF